MNHTRIGRVAARRTHAALAAIALSAGLGLAVAAPASADTNTYADAVGESSINAARDITSYRLSLSASSLTVSFSTRGTAANPFNVDTAAIVSIEVDGDEDADYEAWISGATSWTVYTEPDSFLACSAPSVTGASSVSITIPASCIGSPSEARVAIFLRDANYRYDMAPEYTLREFSAPVGAGPDIAPTDAPQVSVYRFWSPGFNNAHFFTTNETEADDIRQSDANWDFEGPAFSAIAANGESCPEGSPVFRFYSAKFQSHFYTQNTAEKNAIVANDRNWSYEGVAYCAYPQKATGTVALHRFWSPKFGKHFFTADQDEADHIRAADTNWSYEGVAYYVLP